MTRELANVLVDLGDERVSAQSVARALAEARDAGFRIEDFSAVPERLLSWIDLRFGGTWSSEVAAGAAWFAFAKDEPVGFAAYGATGLRFSWLRAWQRESDVGLFGPSTVLPAQTGSSLGSLLRTVAFGSLREGGFAHALVPALADPLTISYYQHLCGGRVVDRFTLDRSGPPLRTTVLASGGGTNFQAVIDAARDGLPLELNALVSNRSDAFALERARRAGISAKTMLWNRSSLARGEYDALLSETVAESEPDLVLLLGWMHVLPASFVERFGEMINIHPAFLPYDGSADVVTMPDGAVIPAFRGAHAIRDALAAGCGWYGATAHRVGIAFDRGEILQRAPLPLVATAGEEEALAALRPTEHGVLLGAIRRVLDER